MIERVKIVVLVDDWSGYNVRNALSEHGLSILVEATYSDGYVARVLLDAGQSGVPLANNARVLGIDLKGIDVVTLSHCHYDHSGGLEKLRELVGRRIPLVLHPAALRPCYALRPTLKNVGIPIPKDELEEAFEVVTTVNPLEVAPGIYFMGYVPRYGERLVPKLEELYIATEKGLEPYLAEDDSALAIKVEGFGGIAILGCGHSGVVNVVKRASEILGDRVRLVVGGLHLISSPRELIEEVAKALIELGVEQLLVGHCTGFEAEKILSEIFSSKFRKIHSCFVATVSKEGVKIC